MNTARDRADGLMDVATYKRTMVLFEKEENDLIMKRTTLKSEKLPISNELAYAVNLFGNFGKLYKTATLELKATLVGSMFSFPLYFEKNHFRTEQANSLFELFVLNTNGLESLKIEKSRFKNGFFLWLPLQDLNLRPSD